MNPTQDTNNPAPKPRRDTDGPANWLAGLLTDAKRFRNHIATAMTKTVPPATVLDETAQPLPGHAPITVPGWCEQCGSVLPWVCTWDQPLCSDCVPIGLIPVDEPTDWTPDVLRSAALYLERHGWIQGGYYDATTGVFTPPTCMVGAIGIVCYGGPVDAPAQMFNEPGFAEFEAAVLHLDRYLLVENGSEAYEFNDYKGRTLEEVTYALRQAAATPAHELIDALRAIDARNDQIAALVVAGKSLATKKLCPACRGPLLHLGGHEYWCATERAEVASYGGDAR
jgi:hypothetical protein